MSEQAVKHLCENEAPTGAASCREPADLIRPDLKGIRVLVAIASYGMRNFERLKRIVENYQKMAFDTKIVVLSEAPKPLPSNVEVAVGLPIKNPWSLPFAHKPIFAERVEQYDLFVYSEDDMGVTEDNLLAFLQVTSELAPDEVAGFLRYEVDSSGGRSLPEAHGVAHWKPDSLRKRGRYTVAEYSNEHAAFYVLTRQQLKAAIQSGGFLRPPHEGKYDMLCSAATDPYTSCGLRKVICLEEIESFLIHHVSNQYVGRLGTAWGEFRGEIAALHSLAEDGHRPNRLCNLDAGIQQGRWSKRYDEWSEEVERALPPGAKTVLSVGAGNGRAERAWKGNGCLVTVVPLTSVKGQELRRRGIESIDTTFEEMDRDLNNRTFDCVVVTNLLHLQKSPSELLAGCARRVSPEGALIVKSPNFDFLPVLVRRKLQIGEFRHLSNFDRSAVRPLCIDEIRRELKRCGFSEIRITWISDADHGSPSGALSCAKRLRNYFGKHVLRKRPTRYSADHWIIRAVRHK